jgi:uncharacterized 2Fe-2S/4Fe-4S cluster protein (DUF4445 family)
MAREIRVTFEPSGRHVYVLPGTVLLEAAAEAGYIIQTPCGGGGKCGKCRVRVTAGTCPPSAAETAILDEAQIAEGYRLACQARVATTALTIEIPDTSLFLAQQKVLTSASADRLDVKPRVRKRYFEMPPPDAETGASDLERLRSITGPVAAGISVLRSLPGTLRRASFKVTAVTVDDELIAIEEGDTTGKSCGLAFDIGTTTIVGTLVNLVSGEDLAVSAHMNPQASFGDDVISRIQVCRKDRSGVARLQAAVLGTVREIVETLLKTAGVSAANIYEIVFTGNTTMQQILCGIDPSPLGEIPFVPAFRQAVSLRAADLGLDTNPEANVYVFPQIGGFVGGDTVAGIIATRLDQSPRPSLLVDIGTNGEIVLAHNGRLIATSVAAGPAFEGARIAQGMRATTGAIEKVILDGDIRINVIGNARPSGICGSGLIDAAAEMLRAGILDSTGRVLGPDEIPAHMPAALRRRILKCDGEYAFVLAPASESATGEPLCLYQRDIRELQLANGAIRAGINILLRMEGLRPSDLDSVLLAGAFGNFIRRRNARRIGMLPPIPCSRIRFVGNAASFGAKRALLSTAEKDYAERIGRLVRHVDLSLSPEFQSEFGEAMVLPACDPDE